MLLTKEIEVEIDIEECIDELYSSEREIIIKKLVPENLNIDEAISCFSKEDIQEWVDENAEIYGYTKIE